MEIILTRFIQIPLSLLPVFELSKDRISLGFLPVAMSGMLFGPLWGGVVAGVADIIRAIILPVGGAFNPLFTITAAMRGVVYGALLHKNCSFGKILGASFIIFLFVNGILNTLFVTISYGTPFSVFFITKLLANTANLILQVIILWIFAKPMVHKINSIIGRNL